jgi:hypothetical protein
MNKLLKVSNTKSDIFSGKIIEVHGKMGHENYRRVSKLNHHLSSPLHTSHAGETGETG